MMRRFVGFRLDVRLILLGFFVALFSAGIGIGGGTLLVSILMSAFGFDFKKAASTSLATIIPISFIGGLNHLLLLPGIPHLHYYLMFIPSCVVGTLFGGRIVHEYRNGWLKFIFSLFLMIVSLRMLKIYDFPSLIYSGFGTGQIPHEWMVILPMGLLIGMIAVLLGIGCGLLIVPFYVIVMGVDIHAAIPLSLTTMFFLSLSATMIHKKLNTLDIVSMGNLFVPALAGAVVGAMISSHLPAPILKQLFGVFLFGVSCMFIVHEWTHHHKKRQSMKNGWERS